MNTRSLRFQLITWYAGLLSACFLLVGAATYFVLKGYLEGAVKESQLRRARQMAQSLPADLGQRSQPIVAADIDAHYAPSLNNRFVRVTASNHQILYVSQPPQDQSFDPKDLPPPAWPVQTETAHKARLPDGREMLVAGYVFTGPAGARYLIESGAPLDTVHLILRRWLEFLAVGLPVAAVVAVGGGYLLVKRALSPVVKLAASAERISSHNLSERLPLAPTGDELEQLSWALNRMIDRLDEAFQYSRRFVADASHELRTPLTVLRGELESSVEEPQLPAELRERLGSALEEVARLANIVEGLFAISRLDAGEAQAEWVRFDLAQLAGATADQMMLLAEDKNIRVTCSAAQPVWVQGDRARLKQVVVNLLDNAIKYTPAGGAITMTARTQNGHALLEVADNGVGIPPEALPRVFDRFFRVDKARSRELGGAGLGLSIVKSICTAHHGRVEVTSTLGQGSCFRVELPWARPGANPEPGERPSDEN